MYMSCISHKKGKAIKNKTVKSKGGVRIIESFTQDTAIQHFIKNSTFSVFSRSNVYGIMVLGKLNYGVDSPYRMVRTNNNHTRVSQILFNFSFWQQKLNTMMISQQLPQRIFKEKPEFNKIFTINRSMMKKRYWNQYDLALFIHIHMH